MAAAERSRRRASAGKRPRPRTSSGQLAGRGVVRRSPGTGQAGGSGPDFRIGCGLDLHPLRPGRRLVLGGVLIPHDRGLEGHSDADVLAHAVCDAIFGALGLSDLGTRFPDTEASNRGRSSLDFLREAAGEARRLGWAIGNIDAVVMAEAPRLAPHLEAMRCATAAALDCPPDRVGVRAKHAEGLGSIGRGEGMFAQAVALLVRVSRGRRGSR